MSLAMGSVLLAGCTAAHYRRAADKEVYKLIQEAEKRVFGNTNAFSIETRYSGRKPTDISPAELIEDRMQTNRRVLALSEALDLAVEGSREYQAQKEQLYLSALSLTGARYEFTPIFFANSRAQMAGSPDSSDVGTVRSRVGVSQLFRTGGRLSVSLANDLLRYFTGKPPGAARNSAINTLSVDLTQPLLRGFGKNDPTVEALTQAERNVVYAIRSFSQYQKQFDLAVVDDYFSLLSMKASLRNNYTNYLRRVELTTYMEARVDRVRSADVEDARTAELGAKISYINSVASYFNELDAFKLRLGLPITETLYLNDLDLRELEKVGLLPVGLNGDAGFHIALDRNLDILNAIDRFEDIKRKVRIAADQLKPSLTLFANASLNSEQPYDYLNFDANKVRYQAGVSLDNLVDKLPARNNYRATVINFESQLRTLVANLDNLRDRIDRGFRRVEQERQNYLNRQASLEVAARRVDMNQTLLAAGRAQVRDLRESQDALVAAQNQLTASIVTYLMARLQLLFDIGVLETTPEQFWLRDPLSDQPGIAPPAAPVLPSDALISPHQVLEPIP
jgi:outer membrane protein TolC